jgi:hypothetical protein
MAPNPRCLAGSEPLRGFLASISCYMGSAQDSVQASASRLVSVLRQFQILLRTLSMTKDLAPGSAEGRREAFESLREYAADRTLLPEERGQAAWLLGTAAGQPYQREAQLCLIRFILNPDEHPKVRFGAMQGLAGIGGQPAVAMLSFVLRSDESAHTIIRLPGVGNLSLQCLALATLLNSSERIPDARGVANRWYKTARHNPCPAGFLEELQRL